MLKRFFKWVNAFFHLALPLFLSYLVYEGVLQKWITPLLFPSSSGPMPQALSWDDPRWAVLADEDFWCFERMDQWLSPDPCDLQNTLEGDRVVCTLQKPWQEVQMGCGLEPKEHPVLYITLKASESRAFEGLKRKLGKCTVQTSPSGEKACFYVGGFRALWEQGAYYPRGVFSTSLILTIDTQGLSRDEKQKVEIIMHLIFDRSHYIKAPVIRAKPEFW